MLHSSRDGGDLVNVHTDPADEKHGMCEKEQSKDRCQNRYGFLHTTKIEQNQNEDYGSFE